MAGPTFEVFGLTSRNCILQLAGSVLVHLTSKLDPKGGLVPSLQSISRTVSSNKTSPSFESSLIHLTNIPEYTVSCDIKAIHDTVWDSCPAIKSFHTNTAYAQIKTILVDIVPIRNSPLIAVVLNFEIMPMQLPVVTTGSCIGEWSAKLTKSQSNIVHKLIIGIPTQLVQTLHTILWQWYPVLIPHDRTHIWLRQSVYATTSLGKYGCWKRWSPSQGSQVNSTGYCNTTQMSNLHFCGKRVKTHFSSDAELTMRNMDSNHHCNL